MRQVRRRIGKHGVSWLGPAFLGALARTWRVELFGQEHLARAAGGTGEARRGHFMALWHGRMVVPLAHHGQRDWQVLVSTSEDGDLSERLLRPFGYRIIHGSTNRGGARALREMLAALERGEVLAITPDGPRGPRHSMNPGLAWMARATGRAVVPCGFVCDRAWRLASWDRFTIPKPRARVALVYGEPVSVAHDATPAQQAAATEEIRARMLAAERFGFERLGVEPDW